MKVKNIGARLWTVDGIKLIPGEVTEIPDEHAKSIEGIEELKIMAGTVKAEDVEFREVPTTKADIIAALTAKGIKFDHGSKKEELQALLDESK